MKPRISMIPWVVPFGVRARALGYDWVCYDASGWGNGKTPRQAYENWLKRSIPHPRARVFPARDAHPNQQEQHP